VYCVTQLIAPNLSYCDAAVLVSWVVVVVVVILVHLSESMLTLEWYL
jgi:hypothetical protein